MNQKKAKALRKVAGFDPKAERRFVLGRSKFGGVIHGTHKATGARRKYRNLKRAYKAGGKAEINEKIRPLEVAMRKRVRA